ncbi:MAG: hypothetical protein N2C14_18805 [Planctomycetales bacterium]
MRLAYIVQTSLICLAAWLSVAAAESAELSESEFQKLHASLKPSADEPWRTIPWKISLLDAQRTAAAQKKPIFIWAMDGHPLGCT